MNAERWFSGDTHVHFLSTQGSHLEAQGEDLNVVNLLLSQWGSLFTNTEEFTGGPTVSPRRPDDRLRHPGEPPALARPPDAARPQGSRSCPGAPTGPSEAELGGDAGDDAVRTGPTRATPRAARSSSRTCRSRTASRRR